MNVFIPRADEDVAAAMKIYHRLGVAGFEVWMSNTDLIAGGDRRLQIKKAVQKSQAVIVCVSNALTKGVGSMHRETKDALDIADEQPEGTLFVIPVVLEPCELPQRLEHLEPVRYFEPGGYESLLRALSSRRKQLEESSIASASPKISGREPSPLEPAAFIGTSFTVVTPPPSPTVNRRSKKRWWVICSLPLLIAAGWFVKREACPPVSTPQSHFISQEGKPKVIVFVHGVLGDMDNTWADPATNVSWPDMITRDPEFRDYDVYVYGYNRHVTVVLQTSTRLLHV